MRERADIVREACFQRIDFWIVFKRKARPEMGMGFLVSSSCHAKVMRPAVSFEVWKARLGFRAAYISRRPQNLS